MPTSAQLEERAVFDSTDAVERELRAFSYIVSHDLAASFRQAAEFSVLLLREPGESLTDRQRAHVRHIQIATQKCQAMMEQLLAFSRIQQRTLQPATLDATLAMRRALLQLSTQARTLNATVTIEPLGQVYADPELIALAFHHLLDNAMKFSRPDVSPQISVSAARSAKGWSLWVFDNGPGVAQPLRDKAFGMFQRLNGEGAYPGVGAGLAISRRIARRHGGELAFIDCSGGACIELTLPHGPIPMDDLRSRPD